MPNYVTALAVLSLALGDAQQTKWTFDKDAVNAPAPTFSTESGQWVVYSPDIGKRVLVQKARSADDVFNVALAKNSRARDFDLSVKLRAMAGKKDQGGGLVWRARDGANYYVARFNPLEDNFRVYKVVDGKRTQLGRSDPDGKSNQIGHADVKRTPGWHTMKVRMEGDHITCALDGKPLLDVHDSTFPEPGMVGLWTKSDAQTQFDDLTLTETSPGQ